ncbi:MAG TPA: dTMP kinase, partial [Erysipelotrichaceae bacterium]|nr:dTMP kinase [Erysipelotrichaceae bacterium]
MKKGLFLTIEGCDGSGKSTASLAVIKKLKKEGYDVLHTREPGGSDIAEQIRKVILDVN